MTEKHMLASPSGLAPYRDLLAGILKDRSVLELCAGTGVLTRLILDAGAKMVTAFENDPELCAKLYKINDERLRVRERDYTKLEPDGPIDDACLVCNPAYSTLPYIVEKILPVMPDAIITIPERCFEQFKQLGFMIAFGLGGNVFDPPAFDTHLVMARGFGRWMRTAINVKEEKRSFTDLHWECSNLSPQETIPERIEALAKRLPRVSLCGIGGFPIVANARFPSRLLWLGQPVTPEGLQSHFREALGLSAVLTYTNKSRLSLDVLGRLCTDRKESWAYHWVTLTMVFAGHSPAVHLAFAHDTRFKLGWAVEKQYTGKLFGVWTASASVKDWLRFTSKKDDPSFDAATREAMAEAHTLLEEILP